MDTRQDLNHPFLFIPYSLLFSSYPIPCGSFFESKFGNLSAFSCQFLELIVLHVDGIFLFFFTPGYLIYHVVFQVSSKGIQLYVNMYFGFPLGLVVKQSLCIEGDLGSIPGMGRYAQRDMTSLSSVLAWRISLTEEPSRPQSLGPQRVRHI